MLEKYYRLTKPGIIRGNVMTAAAGFLLAASGDIDKWLLLATLAGIALIIGCACVINNYIDRDIDAKMTRTKKRALVSGEISGKNALIFAVALGAVGFFILAVYVNWLVFALGLIAIVDYVVLYGYIKRKSPLGIQVGGISGSMSIVAGYCAVTGIFNAGAILLFLILFFWQMPHFYAIAMFRAKEYKAAGIPVLPLVKGMRYTKIAALVYTAIFTVFSLCLTFYRYTGRTYLVVMALIGLGWLYYGIKGFNAENDIKWARKMFGISLIVLLVFSVMISIDNLLI